MSCFQLQTCRGGCHVAIENLALTHLLGNERAGLLSGVRGYIRRSGVILEVFTMLNYGNMGMFPHIGTVQLASFL